MEKLIKLINGRTVNSIVAGVENIQTRGELENYLDEIRESCEASMVVNTDGKTIIVMDGVIYEHGAEEITEWSFDRNRLWLKQIIKPYTKIEA